MKRIMAAAGEHGPFSRLYVAESVREGGDHVVVEADAAERAALAKELGLVAIAALKGVFTLHKRGRTLLRVTGEVLATVTQTCVVSLEAFDTVLREAVESSFAPEPDAREVERKLANAAKLAGAEGLVLSETPDPPDPIVNGLFDLGALAAEFLALGLDPYPRKPGMAFAESAPEADEPATSSPFAVLGNLGKTQESGGSR